MQRENKGLTQTLSQPLLTGFFFKLAFKKHQALSTPTCQKTRSFLNFGVWGKRLYRQEGRWMLYLFTVWQARGDSQTSLDPQESFSLAALSMNYLPSTSHTVPSAWTCWLLCFPELTTNHFFFPVSALYHMSLPVYQSKACMLIKLIKDVHTTTSVRVFKRSPTSWCTIFLLFHCGNLLL